MIFFGKLIFLSFFYLIEKNKMTTLKNLPFEMIQIIMSYHGGMKYRAGNIVFSLFR
jgi:hypothetical protein